MTTDPQHAERILEACQLANPCRFETELENAWRSCRTVVPATGLEWEQQELLETIVENLRGRSVARYATDSAPTGVEFAAVEAPSRPDVTGRVSGRVRLNYRALTPVRKNL